jgi:multidrug resistance efflux pump
MLEVVLCSLFTILPDYLYRHYYQGKRIGHEITLYSVWFELRWGITACIMLTVLLITIIFYNHPSTTNATAYFRTIPIVPETSGRVTEVYVKVSDVVEQGKPLFRLDSSKQDADLDAKKRRVAEVDAQMTMAQADVAAANAQIQQAKGSLQQALDELNTKQELQLRSPGVVAGREIERLQNTVSVRKGGVAAAEASKQAADTRISTLIPAEKASAEAALKQVQVELDKMVVYAGVSGRVEQFLLRVGDVVNPFMRPAGILIPKDAGRKGLQAGFDQLEAQVMKRGMAAEVVCISKPLTVIPMVVSHVQDYIAAGQVRAGEQLLDAQQVMRPGTLLVYLEPLYEDGLDGVPPGSSCIANAYSNNHDRLTNEDLGIGTWIYLHIVDTVAVVHAAMLRAQALMLPIKTLVLSGH